MKQENPRVSVIVPVYIDKSSISKCIKSLMKQTYKKESYEIIIVDNGSSDGTLTTINKFPVRVLVEGKKRSSYVARNRGIRNANNDILAFTDADAIVDRKWLECGVKNLSGLIQSNKKQIVVGMEKTL